MAKICTHLLTHSLTLHLYIYLCFSPYSHPSTVSVSLFSFILPLYLIHSLTHLSPFSQSPLSVCVCLCSSVTTTFSYYSVLEPPLYPSIPFSAIPREHPISISLLSIFLYIYLPIYQTLPLRTQYSISIYLLPFPLSDIQRHHTLYTRIHNCVLI